MEAEGSVTGSVALAPPTLDDVYAARSRIRPYLPATPLHQYGRLDRALGVRTWVKHENHNPTGAFKVRGGINLVAQLTADERRRGVAAATSGNHGQSIAYAARLFGVEARVFVPERANPLKVQAIRDLGAQIVQVGRDFDDARAECERVALREGLRYVHSGDEPHLIAGVATETLEVLESQPGLAALFVPLGGGSGAAGACLVAKAISPSTRVVAVQSEAAPAGYLSWRAGRLVEDRTSTVAEGLAVRTAFALPQRVLAEMLDDFLLVSDQSLLQCSRLLVEATGNLVEPAGAASVAGLLSVAADLDPGASVACIVSGGNITVEQLRVVLDAELPVCGPLVG